MGIANYSHPHLPRSCINAWTRAQCARALLHVACNVRRLRVHYYSHCSEPRHCHRGAQERSTTHVQIRMDWRRNGPHVGGRVVEFANYSDPKMLPHQIHYGRAAAILCVSRTWAIDEKGQEQPLARQVQSNHRSEVTPSSNPRSVITHQCRQR